MLSLPLAMASASQGTVSCCGPGKTTAITAAHADLTSLQAAAIIKAAEDAVQRLEDLHATRAQLDADL